MINVADIQDKNDPQGRSYREVNRARQHQYPVGTLVELDDGVRAWVVYQGRDCDQTPFYTLSLDKNDIIQQNPHFNNPSWSSGHPDWAVRSVSKSSPSDAVASEEKDLGFAEWNRLPNPSTHPPCTEHNSEGQVCCRILGHKAPHDYLPTYSSSQSTKCAVCGETKHTPLRIDRLGGYVCLTCIDKELTKPQAQVIWTPTTEKPHPDKPGLKDRNSVRCLVVYREQVLLRHWDCYHLCWNDEDDDDEFCKAEDVTCWMLAPEYLVRRKIELTGAQANYLYRGFSQLTILDRKDGQHLCYCCNAAARGRSSMNICGTVTDFETCDLCHQKVDRKLADSIPTRGDRQ